MLAGDVLLVKGTTKFSKALSKGQKVIYKNNVSSHVELSIADGTFVHSTDDGGVHLVFLPDELKTCEDGWRVIRLKSLNEQEREEIMKASLHYLRQDYNKAYMGKGKPDASFCSELIAKIYSKAGITILGGKEPSKVAPAHFDEQADVDEAWEDVTEEYKVGLQEIKQDESTYRFGFNTIQQFMARRHEHSKIRKTILETMKMLADSSDDKDLQNIVDNSQKFLKEKRILSFWDETDHLPIDLQPANKKDD
jgi:hypothetical protein